jgi:hypothetical protein
MILSFNFSTFWEKVQQKPLGKSEADTSEADTSEADTSEADTSEADAFY